MEYCIKRSIYCKMFSHFDIHANAKVKLAWSITIAISDIYIHLETPVVSKRFLTDFPIRKVKYARWFTADRELMEPSTHNPVLISNGAELRHDWWGHNWYRPTGILRYHTILRVIMIIDFFLVYENQFFFCSSEVLVRWVGEFEIPSSTILGDVINCSARVHLIPYMPTFDWVSHHDDVAGLAAFNDRGADIIIRLTMSLRLSKWNWNFTVVTT